MKAEVTYSFRVDDADINALMKVPSVCPCDTCTMGITCCGCDDGRAYAAECKPAKERIPEEYLEAYKGWLAMKEEKKNLIHRLGVLNGKIADAEQKLSKAGLGKALHRTV